MNQSFKLVGMVIALIISAQALNAITIDTVPVGDPGNPADPFNQNLVGTVNYNYQIGKYEVTNTQYVAFLNEKAKTDPLGLFNLNMETQISGGISRFGVDGAYSYGPKIAMSDKPVTYIDFYDAARFANWMNNGQGSGDTESGAYTLLGGTPRPSNWDTFTRNPGATWFLPSDDEWYKAAYYQPFAAGGQADNYWTYPTRSNSQPTIATANSAGVINNPGFNVVNTKEGAKWFFGQANVTTVGSAGPLSTSYYGTYDQGGNANEWNDSLGFDPVQNYWGRGNRSGSFWSPLRMGAAPPGVFNPDFEDKSTGFRMATVPEPSTLALAAVSLLALAAWGASRRPRHN